MKFSSVICCAFLVVVALLLGTATADQPCDAAYCRDDGLCPHYFRGICGGYNGDYMVFAGNCYMENHNCKTCTEYKEVNATFCEKKKS